MDRVAASVKKLAGEVSRHTPGPWVVKGSQELGTMCVTDQDSAYIVDRFHLGGHSTEENAANALLIAAAPELFELVLYVRHLITSDAPVAKRIDKVLNKLGVALVLPAEQEVKGGN